jgi:hypothetical protein
MEGDTQQGDFRTNRGVMSVPKSAAAVNAQVTTPTTHDDHEERVAREIARERARREARRRLDAEERGPRPERLSVSLPELLGRETGTRTRLLGDLIAVNEIAMLHGQPRDGKTWAALEIAIALARGEAAFGVPALIAVRSGAVLIIGNEDAEGAYVDRIAQMCRGRSIDPATLVRLHFMVRVGASLDDPVWQARIIAEAKRLDVVLIIIDPLRSVTARTDQGPSEFQPIALYLRRLLSETGAAILIVHHDTKPQPGVVDTRRRAQRASGGGIFSNVDAPIHVVGVGQGRTLLTPEGFKHAPDPAPILFARLHDNDAVRFVVEPTTATSAGHVELHAKILECVANTPGVSGSQVAKTIRTNKDATLHALDVLREAGRLDSFQKGRATRWFLAGPAAPGTT